MVPMAAGAHSVTGSDEANVSFKSAAHVSKKDLKVTDGIKARGDHVDMQV